MIALIYAIRAARALGDGDLRGLLEDARARNEAHDVTGLLLSTHGSFLQILEGEPTSVEDIFARIEQDPRHTEIRLLGREEIGHRDFGGWWMGFASPAEHELAETVPGYKPSTLYPLVDAGLIHNASMARTLLRLYARNP